MFVREFSWFERAITVCKIFYLFVDERLRLLGQGYTDNESMNS